MFRALRRAAPEFPAGLAWLNTDAPLSLSALRGHVVVLDFWSSCCINCMHLLPDLAALERTFAGKPVVFIGVHSAKFEGENDARAITSAIRRYGIAHPVIVDSAHETWDRFGITGWPTVCIIDEQGKLAYKQAGEGQKERMAHEISSLLSAARRAGTLAREPLRCVPTLLPERGTLSFPGKLDFDESRSELVISDSNHNRLLLVTLAGARARVTQQIGSGTEGFADGDFAHAQFRRPQGVCRAGERIYVADTENHAIRVVDLAKKTVSTLAGNGKQATGPPRRQKNTALNSPWDVLMRDNVLYIAMAGSHQIWWTDLATGEFEPFAGTGGEDIVDGVRTDAFFAQPSGLAADRDNLYVADSEVSAIRKISFETDAVMTLVGSGLFAFGSRDGKLDAALLQHPLGLAVRDKKIYVADTYNSAIRMVDLAAHEVRTLIGTDAAKTVCTIGGSSCDFLPLNEPNDVVALPGRLLIADTNNHLLRSFDFETKTLRDVEIVFETT